MGGIAREDPVVMHTEKRLVQKRNEKCLGISFSSPSLTAVYRGRVGDKTRADGIA